MVGKDVGSRWLSQKPRVLSRGQWPNGWLMGDKITQSTLMIHCIIPYSKRRQITTTLFFRSDEVTATVRINERGPMFEILFVCMLSPSCKLQGTLPTLPPGDCPDKSATRWRRQSLSHSSVPTWLFRRHSSCFLKRGDVLFDKARFWKIEMCKNTWTHSTNLNFLFWQKRADEVKKRTGKTKYGRTVSHTDCLSW